MREKRGRDGWRKNGEGGKEEWWEGRRKLVGRRDRVEIK